MTYIAYYVDYDNSSQMKQFHGKTEDDCYNAAVNELGKENIYGWTIADINCRKDKLKKQKENK